MRTLITCLMLMAVTMAAQAQDQKKSSQSNAKSHDLYLRLDIKDHLTHNGIGCVKGELLWAKDSSFIDTIKIDTMSWDGKVYSSADFKVKEAGKYLMKFYAMGYRASYVPLDIDKIYKKELIRQLKPVYMRTLPKSLEYELDEVEIKATKLKFFMDGDTLVYDADAFSLAEGSMLDGLIKKLPGVRLNKGGEITVNGKKVDALLLNGKDFFDNDRELLLENMPAYMVKSVQSYERAPKDAEGSMRALTEKKEMVMNVKLKKEYNASWMANVSGGLGEPLRWAESAVDEFDQDVMYAGRLFGMYFDDVKRAMFYVNANNLNDERTPGEDGEWSPFTQSQGLTNTVQAGGTYSHNFDEQTELYTSLNTSYNDRNDMSHSNSETFLEGGNTYGLDANSSRNYNVDVNWYGSFTKRNKEGGGKRLKNWFIGFSPNFNFSKYNTNGQSASATLMQDVKEQLGKAWLDSIRSAQTGELLKKYAINRTINSNKGDGHNLGASFSSIFSLSPAHNDLFSLSGDLNYNYSDNESNSYEHYLLDYPASPKQQADFRNRYTPNYTTSQSLGANLNSDIRFGVNLEDSTTKLNNVNLRYSFNYNYNKSNNSLYLLQKLDDWSDTERHPLGTLPSTEEMLKTLDADNSTFSRSNNFRHTPRVSYQYVSQNQRTDVYNSIQASLSLPITHEQMRYIRGSQADTTLSRTTILPSPNIYFSHAEWKRNRSIYVYCGMDISAPSLTSLLNIKDDSNPLYITMPNQNLKNSVAYSGNIDYRDKFGRVLFNVGLNGSITDNATASGYIYNKETGVRVVTPENVNGNWRGNVSSGIDLPLDQDEKWRVQDNVNYTYNNSVDLSGVGNVERATKSIVVSQNVNNELSITWRPDDKMEFVAKGEFAYQGSTSDRADFTTINVFDFNYSLMAQLDLPWGLQLNTDITMYSRRGYSDNTMNTNELVWNARATKKLMKGNLLIQLDGFDLLGQLSNVQRNINAQGRTEMYFNVIPSYCLLHFVYRFSKKPKAKV